VQISYYIISKFLNMSHKSIFCSSLFVYEIVFFITYYTNPRAPIFNLSSNQTCLS